MSVSTEKSPKKITKIIISFTKISWTEKIIYTCPFVTGTESKDISFPIS